MTKQEKRLAWIWSAVSFAVFIYSAITIGIYDYITLLFGVMAATIALDGNRKVRLLVGVLCSVLILTIIVVERCRMVS